MKTRNSSIEDTPLKWSNLTGMTQLVFASAIRSFQSSFIQHTVHSSVTSVVTTTFKHSKPSSHLTLHTLSRTKCISSLTGIKDLSRYVHQPAQLLLWCVHFESPVVCKQGVHFESPVLCELCVHFESPVVCKQGVHFESPKVCGLCVHFESPVPCELCVHFESSVLCELSMHFDPHVICELCGHFKHQWKTVKLVFTFQVLHTWRHFANPSTTKTHRQNKMFSYSTKAWLHISHYNVSLAQDLISVNN